MPTYIEYELDDGATILIETSEEQEMGGLVPAARGDDGENVILRSRQRFSEALEGVVAQAQALKARLEALRADEVEVTFGLKTTGELGNFAVGKVGVEANYTVKLKWENPKESEAAKRVKKLRARAARHYINE